MAGLNNRLIVSMTSYPPRIGTAHKAIESIIEQSVKPDEIQIWLAKEEFPNGLGDLPKELLDLTSHGLTIRWCDNLGTHKKYYYSMLENPDAVIITVDDDVVYEKDMVRKLCDSYARHPDCVSAMRVNLITIGEKSINRYDDWIFGSNSTVGKPSPLIIATGVGGILYPPSILSDRVFDSDAIHRCLMNDDIWLKFVECMLDVNVIATEEYEKVKSIEGSQDCGLFHKNKDGGANDRVISELEKYCKDKYDFDFTKYILKKYKWKKIWSSLFNRFRI